MDSITLENFRCFRERQTARLAPLTLLVGENSTGKTSFMAMIRAIWEVAYGQQIPDFKEAPYDLGSYEEIAHHSNANGKPADFFSTGFETKQASRANNIPGSCYFEATFRKFGTIPVSKRRLISQGEVSFEEVYKNNKTSVSLKTARGEWLLQTTRGSELIISQSRIDYKGSLPLYLYPYYMDLNLHKSRDGDMMMSIQPLSNSPDFSKQDLIDIRSILDKYIKVHPFEHPRPYASAPVRSKPKRTYDPTRPSRDPEGDYIPMYLAELYLRDKEAWEELQGKLQSFGRDAGLFDQISIKKFGNSLGSPFQIHIRKYSKKRKGPQRNLVDVGYGVSQVLPLATELLRTDGPDMLLLQQPEVHLHPSARAALASLFCQVAGQNKQLIIETHSDYIMDRVRMDIRDGSSPLKPEDVSLLFFERNNLDVRIHSLRFDELGNVLGTPPGYRQFFMEETRRFTGL